MDTRLLLLLALAHVCLGACVPPRRPPPPLTEQQQLATEVSRLSSRAQALLRTQDELVWKYWTEGTLVDVAGTYQGQDELFSLESIRKVDRLRQLTSEPRELRALTALQSHFAGEYLARQLADVNDALANLEASLTFQVEGRDMRYRELERLLANEKSAVKRKALYTGATVAVQRLNPTLQRREEHTRALVQELGYPSYEAFGGELRQVDMERLAWLAEAVLVATEAPFQAVMERLAQREVGQPYAALTRADLPRLFRLSDVDTFFSKGELLLRVHGTLAGMGLDMAERRNVLIDSKDAPRKNPRPLVLAPQVPGDVRLSVKPAGGVLEQARILHEMGHALHLAFTREARFELAKLGNATVAEAYAALFEDLMEDPVWLEEHAGMTGDARASYLAARSAHKLFLIRRAAGRLLYRLAVQRQPEADMRELYRALLSRVDGLPVTEDDTARYLLELEEFFQSADNFRAWFLAGQLQGQLKARFGPAWWHSPEAGAFLQELWAKGNALSAREVAQALGEKNISPDVLLLRLGTTLQVPIKLDAPASDEAAPPTPPAPTTPSAPAPAAPAPTTPAPTTAS